MDFITSLGFGCSFFPLAVFVVVVEGEGRGGLFEESGGGGAIVSSSSSNSVISLLTLFLQQHNKCISLIIQCGRFFFERNETRNFIFCISETARTKRSKKHIFKNI